MKKRKALPCLLERSAGIDRHRLVTAVHCIALSASKETRKEEKESSPRFTRQQTPRKIMAITQRETELRFTNAVTATDAMEEGENERERESLQNLVTGLEMKFYSKRTPLYSSLFFYSVVFLHARLLPHRSVSFFSFFCFVFRVHWAGPRFQRYLYQHIKSTRAHHSRCIFSQWNTRIQLIPSIFYCIVSQLYWVHTQPPGILSLRFSICTSSVLHQEYTYGYNFFSFLLLMSYSCM